jgi:hypothetical protein
VPCASHCVEIAHTAPVHRSQTSKENAFMDLPSLVLLLDRALWATPPVTTHMLITHAEASHFACHTPRSRTAAQPHASTTLSRRASLYRRAPLFTDALIHDARAREDVPLFTPESRATHRRVASSNSLRATAHPTSQKPHSPRRCRHIFVSSHRKSVVDCGAHHLHMLHMIKGTSTAPTTAPLQRLSALKHFVHRTGHRRIVDHLRRLARC